VASNVSNNSAVNSHFTSYNWAQANGRKEFAPPKELAQYNPTQQTDNVEISIEARNLSLQNLTIKEVQGVGWLGNMTSVLVGQGDNAWRAIITPDGIFKPTQNTPFSLNPHELLDTSTGIPGVAQSQIREMEHLSKMLKHLSSDESTMLRAPNTVAIDGVFDDNANQFLHANLKVGLQRLTNAFGAVREEFGNSNQHIQFTESAFRHLLSDTFLTAQLLKAKSGNSDGDIMNTIELREEAKRQISSFGDVFLSNFREHGTEGAFAIAWKQLGLE